MTLTRRTFLRAAGVSLALPLLERAPPAAAAGRRRGAWSASAPRSGCTPPYFFPEKAGQGLRRSRRTWKSLKDFRDDFTVVSGLSHPEVEPGPRLDLQLPDRRPAPGTPGRVPQHDLGRPARGRAHRHADAVPEPGAVRRGVRPVVDPQRGARPVGLRRRRTCSPGCSSTASRTRSQAQVRRLAGRPEHPRRRRRPGRAARDRTRRRRPRQARRVLHQRPRAGEAAGARPRSGSKKPKPKVDAPPPQDIPNSADLLGRTRLLFDLTHLALQTDSTRLVTIMLGGARPACRRSRA